MKRKSLYIMLAVEFGLLLILLMLANKYTALFSSLFAFPFEQIGAGLRALSLSGRIGNGLATALWAGLSMLPLIPVLLQKTERNRIFDAAALVLLSVSLFLVLRGMANPAKLYSLFPNFGEEALPVIKAIMGSAVWSTAVLWGVLRLLRLFRQGNTNELIGYLRKMLCALCALFTGVIALTCTSSLLSGFAADKEGLDKIAEVIRFLVSALPYAMDIAITLSAMNLMDALLSEDTADVPEHAEKLSRLCCIGLAVVTAVTVCFNLLQLVLARYLSDISVTVEIPVMSIAFVLAALLVSRLIAENRRLKNDNDLFI